MVLELIACEVDRRVGGKADGGQMRGRVDGREGRRRANGKGVDRWGGVWRVVITDLVWLFGLAE